MHSDVFIPDCFLQHIEKQLPSSLSLTELINSCQSSLRRSLRVNTLKISVPAFLAIAEKKGWQLSAIPWCDTGFWIAEQKVNSQALGNSAEHLAGLFYIQEASSMLPVSALLSSLSKQDILVLDMAAAPGSKTTQIAAALQYQGLVVANEYSASRVKILHANQVRTGATHCALTHYDARIFGSWLPETFDAILLDAPCSGEGTIRKDAKAFSNWSLDAINAISDTQKALIVSAFQALKVNGTMVYSTCTLSQEENQQVLHYLKAQFPNAVEFESLVDLFPEAKQALTKEGFLHVFPQIYDTEGFFVAKIRKKTSVPVTLADKKPRKFPFAPLNKKDTELTQSALMQSFGLTISNSLRLWSRDQEIWLFPEDVIPLIERIKFDRIGLKLAQRHKNGFKWQHEAVVALCQKQQPIKIELSTEEAVRWYKGQDIRPDCAAGKGETTIYYQGYAIGIGKWIGNKIKNCLPREMVKDTVTF